MVTWLAMEIVKVESSNAMENAWIHFTTTLTVTTHALSLRKHGCVIQFASKWSSLAMEIVHQVMLWTDNFFLNPLAFYPTQKINLI